MGHTRAERHGVKLSGYRSRRTGTYGVLERKGERWKKDRAGGSAENMRFTADSVNVDCQMNHSPSRPDVLLVSPPRPDWRVHGAANVFSQEKSSRSDSSGITRGAALTEWLSLADALVDAGAVVVVLPFDDDDDSLTGMPYTAEAGFVGRARGDGDGGGPLWLLPTMKPAHRQREPSHVARFAASCGIATRTVPVTWEGQGDVLVVDGACGAPRRFVCTSGQGTHARTSPDAYVHVARHLPGPSLHLRFAAEPWFHGNTFLGFFSARDDEGRVTESVGFVCDDALLPGESERLRAFLKGVRFVTLSRDDSLRYATNALQVGRRVLAPPGVPAHVHEVWRELGLEVVEVALPTLFGRGGGAAVCLTNKLDVDVAQIPGHLRYEHCRQALRALAAA
jgi:N-dimethylarginine dimethylaminohydrolase